MSFKNQRPWHRNNMLGDPSFHSFLRDQPGHFNDLFQNWPRWNIDDLLCDPSLHTLHLFRRSDLHHLHDLFPH